MIWLLTLSVRPRDMMIIATAMATEIRVKAVPLLLVTICRRATSSSNIALHQPRAYPPLRAMTGSILEAFLAG
ncbi:MAG: hypothetical protein A4E43_01032 [Methanosaeta sp. PtaB.Bin005]|nr:MAG: hypothetical protein A4E43_01032 [Methanosaeta sp. PtaB.Bin005]